MLRFSLRELLLLTVIIGLGLAWWTHVRRLESQQRQLQRDLLHHQQLDTLHLDSTQVDDSGLVHLSGLTNLKYLELNKTQVSDAGLVHLSGLTKLRHLDLSDTPVSDAGLVHLHGLTKLRTLRVSGPQVTAAGISELKKALPELEVE